MEDKKKLMRSSSDKWPCRSFRWNSQLFGLGSSLATPLLSAIDPLQCGLPRCYCIYHSMDVYAPRHQHATIKQGNENVVTNKA